MQTDEYNDPVVDAIIRKMQWDLAGERLPQPSASPSKPADTGDMMRELCEATSLAYFGHYSDKTVFTDRPKLSEGG